MPERARPEIPAIPKDKPAVSVVHPAGKKAGLVLGIAVDGDRVVAVGGQGHDLLLMSTNGGKSFRSADSGGGGLRAVRISGESVWVVGEYGHLAYSHDFGKRWTKVPLKTSACLFGIIEDERGYLWTAGDAGFIATSKDGVKFRRVKGITEFIGRISHSSLGVLVPTDRPGHLYIREHRAFRKTSAESGADLMAARVTPRGTLIAVGAGGAVLRSTDGGEHFERVKVASKGLLAGVECFDDGRVVVVGEGGKIFISHDDGHKLTALAHEHTSDQLWCAQRHGSTILLGGASGVILRLE